MAILNKSSDGIVSVLVAMVRTSLLVGEVPRRKFLDICCPKSLVGKAQDMGKNTLNRWHELGLFEISRDEKVSVAPNFRRDLKRCNASISGIARVARQIIFTSENNINFWSDTENRASDFTRAAAWMLAQDVHSFTPTSHATVEPLCNEQASSAEVILLQNDTRWPGYKSWATFLGLGRSESGKASGGFITDPTPALVDDIDYILQNKTEIAIDDFLKSVANSLPVLDGGIYRREVESQLRSEKWKAPAASEVSTSLSRALLRLEMKGILRLEKRSDSDYQVQLLGRGGTIVRSLTHVSKGGSE